MSRCPSGVDYVSAPTDYAALFRIYNPYVIALVRQFGIEESRVEDVASEIMVKLMEKDVIANFDGTRVFTYKGERRPARFKSYLTKIVHTYLKGIRDRYHRLNRREPLMCDMPVHRTAPNVNGVQDTVRWIDKNGPMTPGADEEFEFEHDEMELREYLLSYLEKVPHRGECVDLVSLYIMFMEYYDETGEWNAKVLREHFDISGTATYEWVWRMRKHVAAAIGIPCPTKRPRVVKAKAGP